jgi:hypothetical protein
MRWRFGIRANYGLAGRRRMRNFCSPSSTSSRRWLNTVLRKATTPVERPGVKLRHFQRRIDCVVGKHRLQKPARLFEETDQRFLHQIGKQPGSRRGVDQGLETVGQQIRHAAGAAVFDIVMHGMGVAARGLKGREYRRGHGAAGNDKTLAEHEILKPALLRHHAVPGGIELGHACLPAGVSGSSVSQRCCCGNWFHGARHSGLTQSAPHGEEARLRRLEP